MTDVLRIKRRVSGAPGAPVGLANAELAYNEVDHILYYGEGTGGGGGTASVIVGIGGNGLSHNVNPLIDGTASAGVSTTWSRGDHVHPTDTTRAPLNSPAFTGVPTTAATPAVLDNSLKLSTTQYVDRAVTNSTQTITLTQDVTGSGTGSFATTIAAQAVIYAKIQNVTGLRLLGNPTGLAASPSEISLGTNLSFAGTVLNAAAAPVVISGMTAGQIPIANTATTITSSGNLSGDVATNNSLSTVIQPGRVTLAMMQNRAAGILLGNPTGAAAALTEITLGTGLSFAGSVLNAVIAPTVISGMTAGQIPIAATANTITSSGNLSGDIQTTNSLVTTITNVNPNVGTFQGITINNRGLVTAAVNQSYAPLASPTFTGTPIAPLPANGTTTNQIATCAFVLATRHDQLDDPTSDVSWNNQKITGLADPTLPQDAATKNYVDGAVQGLATKDSVRAATTGNITLSAVQVVDGVTLVVGDRVLVKNQTTPAQNGIYVVAAGAWTRSLDADIWNELVSAYVFTEEGTTNAGNGYQCTVAAGGTLGTTPITWVQFSGAGQITAGGGLTKTGNQLDAVGTAARITVNADSIDIASTYVGQTSITTIGTIATGTWAATTIAVNRGGTGATTLTGYLIGNGVAAVTASATIPNTAITGLGTMSTQNANAVAITGGAIDGITFDMGTF